MMIDGVISRGASAAARGEARPGGNARRSLVSGVTVIAWTWLFCPAADAASPPLREHVLLPPTRGATELSAYIDAQARYIVAVGDFLESEAIARRHRAEAFSREMDNALKWVETYFERRALNKVYRLKENPPYMERVRSQQKVKEDLIISFPDEVRKGEPSVKLNWLLNQIAYNSLAYSVVHGSDDRYLDSDIDLRLLPGDADHIWLKEVAALGQSVIFRASDAKLFDEDWPLAFRAEGFAPARKAFEVATAKALNEIRTQRQISWNTFEEMRRAVDGLSAQLEGTYSDKERKKMPAQDWIVFYDNSRRFVKSLAASVIQVAATNRMETFDGSNRFDGDSVFDLVRHMCHRGLVFAPQKPGDEPTYNKLLVAMRHIYVELHSLEAP